MKTKKGFTLIELLAVIVILAIIALIATPIILNIISDAKEESNERSVELYASAVKNAVAKYQLNGTGVTPGSYTSSSDGKTLTKGETELTVEYNGNVSCTTIEIYEDGNIYLAGCNGDYTYGKKHIEVGKLDSICTLISGTALTAGAKYSCKLNDTTSYNFYVITTPTSDATTVSLIMDRNICEDGTPTTETNHCDDVYWNADDDDNSYGPITAMNYLAEATKNWTNLENIQMDYTDEGNIRDYGYGTIKTVENITTITKKDGTVTATYTNLKARLPYYLEVGDYDAELNNAYLYDNMMLHCYDAGWSNKVACDVATIIDGVNVEGISHIEHITGYWTISSSDYGDDGYRAISVNYDSYVHNSHIIGEQHGIRPVITLSI